jgi:hypothetical protein
MIALIDADILPYEIGGVLGEEVPFKYIMDSVDNLIARICRGVGATKYECYLTESSDNFRIQVAKLTPYKGGRKHEERPHHWAAIRKYILDNHNASIYHGYEADDALAVQQSTREDGSTIICSRDKDLRMVPGWHYSWSCGKYQPEKPPYYVTELEGWRWFCKQMIMGDVSVDNIMGCVGYGAKKAEDYLEGKESKEELILAVEQAYRDRYGEYEGGGTLTYRKKDYLIEGTYMDLMEEMADLLWMVREWGVTGRDIIREVMNEIAQAKR